MTVKNIEDVTLFQIDKTSKTSKIYSQRELDKLGIDITVEQWIVLKIVHENDAISQKELATKSLRDPASITRSLDLLQKKNLIERLPVPNNRRQYSIILTTEGKSFINKNLPIINQQRSLSIKGFTKQELHVLHDFLLRIQRNMT